MPVEKESENVELETWALNQVAMIALQPSGKNFFIFFTVYL